MDKVKNIKGVGVWTMNWLKNEYSQESIFISSDLEVRKGLSKFLKRKELISIKESEEFAKQFPDDIKAQLSIYLIELSRQN